MATITPVTAATAGAVLTFAAASGGGDSLVMGTHAGHVALIVTNGGGSPITVTLTGVTVCSQGSAHNQVATVGAGVTRAVLVQPNTVDPVTGNVAVGYSGVTTVTVAALLTA